LRARCWRCWRRDEPVLPRASDPRGAACSFPFSGIDGKEVVGIDASVASLRKLPDCKNFIACFTDIEGRRRQRSTGTPIRRDARRIAQEYEAAARGLRTETQIRKVLADLFKLTGGAPLQAAERRSGTPISRQKIGGKR
jgi:hypothetical protein